MSSQLRNYKYIPLCIGLVCIITLIYYAINGFDEWEDPIAAGLFVIICGFLYYGCDNFKTASYDSENLYVEGKKSLEVVSLKNVDMIKLTMMRLNYSFFWKIRFRNKLGKSASVRILPLNAKDEFENFKKKVLEHNRNVLIKNSSNSFDLDQ